MKEKDIYRIEESVIREIKAIQKTRRMISWIVLFSGICTILGCICTIMNFQVRHVICTMMYAIITASSIYTLDRLYQCVIGKKTYLKALRAGMKQQEKK